MSNLSALLPGTIALGVAVATALRDSLSAAVPPSWWHLPSPWRPVAASFAGASVALLTSEQVTRDWTIAGCAALASLAVTVPRLIYAERSA